MRACMSTHAWHISCIHLDDEWGQIFKCKNEIYLFIGTQIVA
ncbi:unnamed protein product [Musa acuminata subsp. malaccensis]|uniref:(wild Malaysian banana) hypothetical protein n=1 Tax=Musa acuminata subsp. malaccensis TaxID=214687 RepID=A0A804I6Q4_MUSAM|nr:unnamed protein product [Musa acuminata subsp. malaccensis]